MFISCLHLFLMQVQKKHVQLTLQYLGLSLPQNICLLSQSFLLTPHHHHLLVSSMLLCPFISLLVNMFEYQNQQDGKRRVLYMCQCCMHIQKGQTGGLFSVTLASPHLNCLLPVFYGNSNSRFSRSECNPLYDFSRGSSGDMPKICISTHVQKKWAPIMIFHAPSCCF